MKIGELARRAGVGVQTIRFYEREGLVAEPERTASGYRLYALTDLERVRIIRVCQQIGFTLADVKAVIEPHRVLASGSADPALRPAAREAMLASARQRLRLIEEKLELLRRMRSEMASLVQSLSGEAPLTCPAAARSSAI
jgi:MerR family Zn(II)-responsive transcriptional regulator of zntA